MAAKVIPIKKGWAGNRNQRHFEAKMYQTSTPRRMSAITAFPAGKNPEDQPTGEKCEKCKQPVRRSWKTQILWDHCSTCRGLMMIYGPNIEVTYKPEE